MVDKVTVTGIDADLVEKDESFPSAYAFYIALSSTPDPIWVELFISRYESTSHKFKIEITIHGSRIRVVTKPGEEEKHVKFIEELVDETNRMVEDHNKMLSQDKARDQSQMRDDTEAQKVKERLRRIHIA